MQFLSDDAQASEAVKSVPCVLQYVNLPSRSFVDEG